MTPPRESAGPRQASQKYNGALSCQLRWRRCCGARKLMADAIAPSMFLDHLHRYLSTYGVIGTERNATFAPKTRPIFQAQK